MILFRATLVLGALFLSAAAVRAETPGKPYAPVIAAYDRAAEDDTELADLLKAVRAGVEARDAIAIEAEMSAGFVALDCPANPLKPCAPGKAKIVGGKTGKPIDRMRLAFCCEGKPSADTPAAAQNETMFAILAATLGASSLGANPDAKAQICAPALPGFDRARAAKAAKAAGIEPENLRIASAETILRARPVKEAEAAGKLAAGELAPVVTELTADVPPGWTAIGMPDGGIGFTDALGLEELTPAAICFGKEKGRWRIVATIQRGS